MCARGLRRDPSRIGTLAGGQGAAIEKRQEHCSPRGLPNQRRFLGYQRARDHLPYLTPDPVKRSDEYFDADRSVGVVSPSGCMREQSDGSIMAADVVSED